MAKKVLIVDDEPLIVKGLRFSLEQDGYEVTAAYDGEAALESFQRQAFDIILLDVMLPGISGTDVCRKIRETSMVPIIMLTAKSEDTDKIMGLEYGADDYMTKPFNVLEVKVRMKNILRRSAPDKPEAGVITYKGMAADRSKRSVTVDGKPIGLTAKEFDILMLFMNHPGRVYKREDLLQAIWHTDYTGDVRTVDVHIRRLRKKIEKDPDKPEYIYTKWGVGYYFAET